MKLSNNELANILREIKPFTIDSHLKSKEFKYPISKDLEIFTVITINRSGGFTFLVNDGGGIRKESMDPVCIASFEGTQIFFDDEDISDNYQKEMIEEYLKIIVE